MTGYARTTSPSGLCGDAWTLKYSLKEGVISGKPVCCKKGVMPLSEQSLSWSMWPGSVDVLCPCCTKLLPEGSVCERYRIKHEFTRVSLDSARVSFSSSMYGKEYGS